MLHILWETEAFDSTLPASKEEISLPLFNSECLCQSRLRFYSPVNIVILYTVIPYIRIYFLTYVISHL